MIHCFILLDLIRLLIFCEDYKLLSSSLCNFLHPSVTFSSLRSKYLLKILSRIIQSNVVSKNSIYSCKCKSDKEWFWTCHEAKFMIIQSSEHLSSQQTYLLWKGQVLLLISISIQLHRYCCHCKFLSIYMYGSQG